jgi:endonuclease YncB( thermonuclease family)
MNKNELPTNITVLDTKSLYDSTEHLDRLDRLDRLDSYDGVKYEDTIPFIPPITSGLVIKVYDGDTITIASKLPYGGSPLYRFSVRLNGIDAPEIKSKSEEEKKLAKVAKDALSSQILNKVVTLKNVQLEKYGRILADVIIDGQNMSEFMLDKKLAVKYDGGTKGTFEDNFVNN